MQQQLEALTRRLKHRLSPAILVYWGALLGGLYLFVELAEETYKHEGFWFDEPLLAFFAAHRTELLDHFFRWVTWIGSSAVLIPIGILILFGLLRSGYYASAILLGVGFGGASLITHLTKLILVRHRPELFPSLIEPLTNFSFPSGHATQITAFMVSLFLIVRRIRPHWQLPFGVFTVMSITAVAISRVYLQVHYPSDVIAGLLVATSWVLGVDGLLKWQENKRSKSQTRTGDQNKTDSN